MRKPFVVVGLGYLTVLAVSAVLVFARYRQYANDPAGAVASGGMYAWGDWLLALFIGGLFLMPTLLLVLVIRKSETASVIYARTLLGLSLSAPMSLAVFVVPAVNQGNSLLGWISVGRLSISPIVVIGLGISRLLASFDRAKRPLSYAFLTEVGTIAVMMGLLFFSIRAR